MIEWSGVNWYYRRQDQPTIYVIERPSESYDDYHERMKREDGREKVPFGFARAVPRPDTERPASSREQA